MKLVFSTFLLITFMNVSGQKKITTLDIEKNDDFSSFSMLDSAAANHSVFFTGENHNFRNSNYKLQLKMLKYLNKNFGVNHLFLEFGISRGWLVNNYVQTGDSATFKILKNYSYDEYATLYKELMLFNKTLPDDKKIMIHGIDIERSYSTPIKVLSMLLPKITAPKSIQLNIEAIKSLAGKVDEEHIKEEVEDEKLEYNYNDYKYNATTKNFNTENSLELIIKDYESKKEVYDLYLGDNAPLFGEIIKGIKAEFERDEMLRNRNIHSYIFREQFLYDQLLALTKQYPGEKFYGQFGRCHTALESQDKWCDFYFFNSLASRINSSEEPELKNKVLSIGIYYPESNSFEITASNKDKLNKLFEKQTKEGIKLIEIDQKDSLFYKGVANKFQFLILNFEGFKLENTNINKDYDYTKDNSKFQYGYTFPNVEAHYGYLFLNLKNIHSVFANYDLPQLKSYQTIYGFAATVYEDEFLYGSISAHFLPKSTSNYSDTSSLSFSGLFIKGYFSFDATFSEIFNIFPRLGIGYGKLEFQQKFSNPQGNISNTSIFTSLPSSEFYFQNQAILLDPSIDFRFNMRYIALGLNTGYQIDLSNKKWIGSYNGMINDSPNTSLSGFYAVITLSLFYSLF